MNNTILKIATNNFLETSKNRLIEKGITVTVGTTETEAKETERKFNL